jgi:Flp pilus assembly protein TadD
MSHRSTLWRGAALGLAVAWAGMPCIVTAQAVVQPIPGTTDADKLAEQMRALAANPRDLPALLRAGELSLELEDLSGAASLFARAEKIDPRSARLKAGEASVLVRSERPGQALRFFALAEQYGLNPASFASDRGLAYDLIGEQERAQRDYRLALKQGPDPEITRRYALSLGISGKRDAALALLDPLLRDTDRGAWRARAFVLAMSGDVAGAERIATTMMPPGMADGLLPFFQRLPSLPAVDRAFAVHFGEIRATPERIADARLVPALPTLGPDPEAPVQLARVETKAPVETDREDRKKRRKNNKEKPGRVELAAAVPQRPSLPPVPAYQGQPIPTVAAATDPLRSAPMNATARANAQALANMATPAVAPTRTTPSSPPVTLAAATPTPTPTPAPTREANAVTLASATTIPTPSRSATSIPAQPAAAAPPPPAETRVAMTPSPAPAAATLTSTPTPVEVATAPPPPASTPPASTASADPADAAASTGTSLPGTAAIAPGFSLAKPAEDRPVPTELAKQGDDSVLARIVAGLSIPASELGVPDMPGARPAPAPEPEATLIDEAKAKEARDIAAEKLLAEKAAAEKTAAEKRAADRKAAAEKKALADKKAADAKKAAEAKAEADARAAAKKAERANPSRIWVQVAGGAHEPDLPKAWAAVKARAPKVMAGKSGWWTPLRATNRVLAGPFKTDGEARDFVNALAREGVSAFPFTSDAGQQITRLPTK